MELVEDSEDSTVGVLQVTLDTSVTAPSADITIPITAIMSNAATSQLSVTLKKPSTVYSFTMSAPDDVVASGETATLPFTAYDQDGNEVTLYSKLYKYVSFSSSTTLELTRNADGTASLEYTAPTVSIATSEYLVATVSNSGKTSALTLTIQKPVAVDSLSVTTSNKTLLETGATEGLDFGYDYGGMSLLDQYDRTIDITNQNIATTGSVFTYYTITAASSASSKLTVSGSAYNRNYIKLTAVAPGSATVTYTVYKVTVAADGTQTTAATSITKAVTYTVIDPSSITDYKVGDAYSTIKTIVPYNASINTTKYATNYWSYAEWLTVYGTTSSGSYVNLASSKVKNIYLSNTDFTFEPTSATAVTSSSASTCHGVWARTFDDSTTTGSTATLTYVVEDSDGNLQSASTTVTSKTDDSVCSDIAVSASNSLGTTGLSVNGTTITVDMNNANYSTTLDALNGGVLTKYYGTYGVLTSSPIYFYATDQYASVADVEGVTVGTKSFAATTNTPDVTISNNVLSITNQAYIKDGDYFTLTATTANGLVATAKVVFSGTGSYTPVTFATTTDSTTANDVATLGLTGTAVASSKSSVATAAISNGYIAITSVAAGTAKIAVTDGTHTAYIPVTVAASGAIKIGTIVPYSVTFASTTNSLTANTVAVLGVVGTMALSADESIATVAISGGNIAITSVAAGKLNNVTDGTLSATIPVTVATLGTITLETIVSADTTAPTVTALGSGSTVTIVAAGGTASIVFSEELNATSESAVQAAITAAATGTGDVLAYSWSGATLTITNNGTTAVTNDATITADVTMSIGSVADMAGNANTTALTIVDAA